MSCDVGEEKERLEIEQSSSLMSPGEPPMSFIIYLNLFGDIVYTFFAY